MNSRADDSTAETKGAPLFVRGIMPRSGTNFLGDVTKLHPALAAYPNDIFEFPHFRYSSLLLEYVDAIDSAPKARQFDKGRFMHYLGQAWLRYFSDYTDKGKRILLKEPSVTEIDTVFDFFPYAYVLIITRDGRDLITSALNADWIVADRAPYSWKDPRSWLRYVTEKSDFQILCQQYAGAADTIVRFENSASHTKHRDQIMRVSYEDLFRNTEPVVRAILDWAGLPCAEYDWEALKQLPVRGSSFLRGDDGEMDFGEGVQKSGSFNPIGRWAGWSPKQRRLFERITGPSMRALGYDYDWAAVR